MLKLYYYFDSTMKTQDSSQYVSVKVLDFIQLNPSTILNIYHHPTQNRLYVSREHYSEIYQIKNDQKRGVVMQQIAELQPSLYFISLGGLMALFKPYQLKIYTNGKWEYHSFTTQLLSIRVAGSTVYTFHEKEAIAWHFDQDNFTFQYLTEAKTPYHLDAEGAIVGQGKKVKHISKGTKLIRCEVIQNKWIFVGDDRGALHVYDWKFLSHLKSFHEHEGPILAIKADPKEESVYFSGSDSKISMIRLVGTEWKLGEKCRGQSHDVLSLQLYEGYLISGGITTDFCFYPLQKGEFEGSFYHRISYCGVNRISSQSKYVVVNHRRRFEIWQLGSNIYHTNLLVRYEMPKQKFIVDCKLYKQEIQEGTFLVLIITDEDTIGWKFHPETGLTKYITIQNQYQLVELLPKHSFLGIRSDGFVERVNCLNGKIQELTNCEVELPTQIQYLGNGEVLVGSKVTGRLNILNIRKKESVKQWNFQDTFTYVAHLKHQELIVQYFDSPILWSLNLETEKQNELARLPVALIRFGGWLSSVSKMGDKQVKSKLSKYWFGVSEGKVVVIPNLQKEGKKKVRVKQTDRIAQVIRPAVRSLGCNLAVVPYNFTRMIDQLPVKPLFTKKIV